VSPNLGRTFTRVLSPSRRVAGCVLLLASASAAESKDVLVVPGITGTPGGTLVYAQRSEAKTLNPLVASDSASREVIQRIQADLIHINRATGETEPALAKSWTVSTDGLHYTLQLREGLRFSDGQPFDADDVLFSFQAYLDEKVHSPQRDLLVIGGKPIAARKLGPYQVAFDLPGPYAAAERLFDGFAILPRHILEKPYRDGKLAEAWSLATPPAQVAGLGPFCFKRYVPGQELVFERNPNYWKSDAAGTPLPYLAELKFVLAGGEDMQVARFEAGESDLISRVGPRNFEALEKRRERRGYRLADAGPGLEYSFLFFNLNDLAASTSADLTARQAFFRREAFRRAVSLAIDRDALVRLVYLGRAAALTSPVPRGDRLWLDSSLPSLVRSVPQARELLAADKFHWAPDGSLLDPSGRKVEFSIVTSSGNPERVQMATLIQDDLKQLGMTVHVAPLEFRSLLARVFDTHDYEACVLSLAETDFDPNPGTSVWLSDAPNHFWHPEEKVPATPWEGEIDTLMRRQMTTLRFEERKRLVDRVQEIAMEHLPLIPLLTPDVLVAANGDLLNFHPALMEHNVLWNVEELSWKSPAR